MLDKEDDSIPRKILVVDDEPAVHKMIELQLSQRNFNIVACTDSEQILKVIDRSQPDLVLMDLMMPKLDGISATRRIRNRDGETYLPIIIITAMREVHNVVAALEAGADDYLTKPFEIDELHARIKSMLRLKNLQDSLLIKKRDLDEANMQITRLNQVLTNTNKQLQKKIYDLHNLFEISFDVMGKTEPVDLVRAALLNALGIFTAKSAMLMLNDPNNSNIFRVIDSKGFLHKKIEKFTVHRHDKLIYYLELIRKPFQVSDIVREFKEIVPMLNDLEIKVVAPLYEKEDIVGVLCLGPSVTETEYSPDVVELLGIVTNMLSVALNNSKNFAQIKSLSYTDGMTGLHNYRFFQLRLREEVARARRNDLSLCLLITDVDFFKNYNDTLGHPAGDEILRALGNILKQTIRDNDIVARYGGEEFAIILPATHYKGARALSERLRKKVEQFHFPRQEIQPTGNLTVSVGVSIFPDDSQGLEDLIIAADQALYHAKNTGRNRTIFFSELKNKSQKLKK